jgi:pilus assembly protein CpaC
MHRIKYLRRRALAGLAALAGMTAGTALAQPPAKAPDQPGAPAEVRMDKTTGALIVPLGGAVRFTPGNKLIADVFVRNEDVLQARFDAANPKTLVLTGRQAGATQITVTFDDKARAVFDVVVQPDYELLRQVIRRTVPTATVDVVPGVGNVIILTGYVTRPEDSDTVAKIASSAVGGNVTNVINNLQIGGAQHVLIDVTLAQVDRSEIRRLGVDFAIGGTEAAFRSTVSGLLGGTFSIGGGIGQGTISPNTNLTFGIAPAQIFGAIQALRTEGLAKFLSEPKVITQSGRPAFIRAGGQQAVLGPASGINGPGVILENVGTQVEVLPIVFGNGKIYLEVNPQFRSVNNSRGLNTGFGFTPGFNEQQTRSSVLLESGQTFAIGGLIENETEATTNKIPYLGDLPAVGTLFRSVEHSERETELLVLVTPRLVDAMDCNQVPRRVPGRETRSPDDYELFVEGLLEAPRGQRRVHTGNCKLPAYLCDPTACKFPCVGNLCGSAHSNCAGGCAPGGCATPAGGPVVAPVTPVVPVPVAPVGGTTPAPIP